MRSEAGVTLVETIITIAIIVIGLAALFSTSAQSYMLLRKAKEVVAAREDILSRLETIQTLSYSQLSNSSYLSSTLMTTGTAGDASPYGMTTAGMNNFTETVTVYALGSQLFSSDADRANATPDTSGETASEINSVAPAAPATYQSTGTTQGAWSLQSGTGVLPYIEVTRAGTASLATTTVVSSGTLTSYALLLVDVELTWTDSNHVSRTQMASSIVSKSGSLP